MIDFNQLELWFVTGSQHLYGQETLNQVADHSRTIAEHFNRSSQIPFKVVFKPVMTTADAIYDLCLEANAAKNCIGLVLWMHTFSPAKMWLAGLSTLNKPFVHLHTQYNRELPWSTIDMDFMNLNQSAHGDREFGYAVTRLRRERKVIVGFWQDEEVLNKLGVWSRAACAWNDAQSLKVARFGDNMRNVAVTEGDKVDAQIKLRYTVSGFGIGDLVSSIEQVSDSDTDRLVSEYEDTYAVAAPLLKNGEARPRMLESARIELGLRRFLDNGGFKAFTDTFEILHGMPQLPGVAVQRLMADGYGFGAEGDWKTSALVRAMKVMAHGLPGGTSFMEDYTYDLQDGGLCLGAHMLEVCPSIAESKPSLQVHPLGIGGKLDPVRLVFTTAPGDAINATIVDMGSRFRLIVNQLDVVESKPLPKLPVASAVWKPQPNLSVAAEAWIHAGGAHHTGFSQPLTVEHMECFAEMAGIEFVVIDNDTKVRQFKQELRWNDLYYHIAKGIN